MRSSSPQLGALKRQNAVGILLHSSATRAEVIVNLNQVALAQGASIVDSGGRDNVGDGDVGAELVRPVFL
jgi:hypothetical protein